MPEPASHLIPSSSVACAASVAARPSETARHHLRCVKVEAGEGKYRLSATDGRSLAVVTGDTFKPAHDVAAPAEPPSEPSALIDAVQLRAITRRARRRYSSALRVRLGATCRLHEANRPGGPGREYDVPRVEGSLPDFSKAAPSGPPAAALSIDPRRLCRLLEAAASIQLFGDPASCTLELHGEKLVVRTKGFHPGQEFYGLMMALAPVATAGPPDPLGASAKVDAVADPVPA